MRKAVAVLSSMPSRSLPCFLDAVPCCIVIGVASSCFCEARWAGITIPTDLELRLFAINSCRSFLGRVPFLSLKWRRAVQKTYVTLTQLSGATLVGAHLSQSWALPTTDSQV